jgi:hypothetical protein
MNKYKSAPSSLLSFLLGYFLPQLLTLLVEEWFRLECCMCFKVMAKTGGGNGRKVGGSGRRLKKMSY